MVGLVSYIKYSIFQLTLGNNVFCPGTHFALNFLTQIFHTFKPFVCLCIGTKPAHSIYPKVFNILTGHNKDLCSVRVVPQD